MYKNTRKSLLVLAFSLFIAVVVNPVFAGGPGEGEHGAEAKKGVDMKELIFGHIMDGHEFHFFDIPMKDGTKKAVTIPLPVILYSPQKGLSVFMSSKFEHGHHEVDGYNLVNGKVVPVDPTVKVYDMSMTRNVVQMILALALLTWIMVTISRKYKGGQGVTSAPKGMQGFMEPIITFVRDEISVPYVGKKSNQYLPFFLTIFFFILINNIFGLIPGTANVSGNIAFTLVLGVISFVVILASSNKHFWVHIFNPPGVPTGVKFILVPVEFLGLFIKPFALIIRLFANMVAGHIIIICLISLIFIFGEKMGAIAGWSASPLSLAFTIFIYFIEVLVAFIQAFIFANLTAVFIGQAIEGDHSHDDAHAAH